MTAGLHPELPTIRRERGRQAWFALLRCERASVGRAAAIDVKSLDRHAGILGTYRRKRLRIPCMYMCTLAHHWRAAESTYGAYRDEPGRGQVPLPSLGLMGAGSSLPFVREVVKLLAPSSAGVQLHLFNQATLNTSAMDHMAVHV